MRDNSGLGSEEVDYLPEIQTLMKQKPSNASIRTSRISRSYTSNKVRKWETHAALTRGSQEHGRHSQSQHGTLLFCSLL